jgi:hypothetical protein
MGSLAPGILAMTTSPWLSLTGLGRIYGISAVHCGRILSDAGLRQENGAPSCTALKQGLAYQHHPRTSSYSTVWNGEGCATLLREQGLRPMAESNLIDQWADLLSALEQGSPSISTSAEEMASDLPANLVAQVNQELRQRGCRFQVRRKASACRRARSSSSRS